METENNGVLNMNCICFHRNKSNNSSKDCSDRAIEMIALERATAIGTLGKFLGDIRERNDRVNRRAFVSHSSNCEDDWLADVMIKALIEWRVATKKLYRETKDMLSEPSDRKEDNVFDQQHKWLLLQFALEKFRAAQAHISINARVTEEDVYVSGLLHCLRDWMNDWKAKYSVSSYSLLGTSFWVEWEYMFAGHCMDGSLRRLKYTVEQVMLLWNISAPVSDVTEIASVDSWKTWLEEQDKDLRREKKKERTRRKNKRNRLRARTERHLDSVEREKAAELKLLNIPSL